MENLLMNKDNRVVNTLISAIFITAAYIYLSYGVFIAAQYLSLTRELLSLKEITDFACILVGVVFDRLSQRLSLRDRLIAVMCLVVIPALAFKFVL
jgi:hypothetical protein